VPVVYFFMHTALTIAGSDPSGGAGLQARDFRLTSRSSGHLMSMVTQYHLHLLPRTQEELTVFIRSHTIFLKGNSLFYLRMLDLML
jgi:hypothetical protein